MCFCREYTKKRSWAQLQVGFLPGPWLLLWFLVRTTLKPEQLLTPADMEMQPAQLIANQFPPFQSYSLKMALLFLLRPFSLHHSANPPKGGISPGHSSNLLLQRLVGVPFQILPLFFLHLCLTVKIHSCFLPLLAMNPYRQEVSAFSVLSTQHHSKHFS